MKAIVWTAYGPPEVLRLEEVDRPSPGDKELLIRVRAATVSAGDCEMRRLEFPALLRLAMRAYTGLRKPTRVVILGQELAGEVEATGGAVKRFKKGDAVFAATEFRFGTYAQYACLPEDGVIAPKPASMSFEEAATVPVGGLNALYFLRKADIQTGEEILISGAGGSIGTVAVQVAKSLGARVTAVDSAEKLDMLLSLGADRVIDYTRENFAHSGTTYDVIFDVPGKGSFSACLRSLEENGRYVVANPSLGRTLRGPWASVLRGRKVVAGTAPYRAEDLLFLKELIEAGKLRSVIDRRYPLEQTAEAHKYVEAGRKKGNVVLTVAHEDGG